MASKLLDVTFAKTVLKNSVLILQLKLENTKKVLLIEDDVPGEKNYHKIIENVKVAFV